ncbi:glyoxylate/hydroxypyruvate reductase A [Methylopila capsulata]|uniref:Glyoxylate/hydroxypyruvate reductase A n=1 Tax=Methylopila capsulata TaxID=61654 RepID=A0A9W6IV71_9HYPH|nr:glyoxylate/hydroxypyruvate reductase A [Methylopila capsulata]MBM7850423.1 glyoxylate/hydroxypyruvate reductase A [Methylopila capsulata]GLK55716.1 glyoxylate/hydroxypyruvate reductase A [Methylopila capsulata]
MSRTDSDTLVFHSAVDVFEPWRAALATALPNLDVRRADDVADPASVRYALVWNPPQGFFARFPNLALVINLGAGVDALTARDDLPDAPVTRLSDPLMARMMAGYVLFAVLRHARDIPVFERAQREGRWAYVHPRAAEEIRVGVMGLGELGAAAAKEIARQGFDVRGWSRSPKTIEGVACSAGMAALSAFLGGCEILVVMLPLTPETRGLLSAERLALLPEGAKFVNVSRGPVVDEAALVDALTRRSISDATLDVFETEPLPETSPLWRLDNVLITPHLASIALPTSAATQIAENVRRIRSGQPPLHAVDRRRGY